MKYSILYNTLQIQFGLLFGVDWPIRSLTSHTASRNGCDVALQAGLKRTYDCGLNVFGDRRLYHHESVTVILIELSGAFLRQWSLIY